MACTSARTRFRPRRNASTRNSTTNIASSPLTCQGSPSRPSTCRMAARIFRRRCGSSKSLEQFAAEYHASGRQLVLCGDFNIAPTDMDVHPKERKPNSIGQLPDERALFQRILGTRPRRCASQHGTRNAEIFTWWAPWRNMRQRNIGWRLDMVLASEALAAAAISCAVQREFGSSDHGPVIAVFERM